ncbi:hypothetical protein [Streptomyces yerevanensis]|uniref:hypothetical protein n=1 Tax=Streptomyces yerevanensis TaxID=66378 RepID=UPI0005248DFD|nr:hypothetical protein [Streptomyces yerevanensis]
MLDDWQHRAARAQPSNGLLSPATRVRGVVAFVDKPDAGTAEALGGEQPVSERMGNLPDPALLRGCGMAGQQLDAATAIEVRAYLIVLHLTPLLGMVGSH